MSNSFAQHNLLSIAGPWEVNNTGPTSMNVHNGEKKTKKQIMGYFSLSSVRIFDHKYKFKFGET